MIRCYLRVSTDEQGDSGAGLQAQERALEARWPLTGENRVPSYADVASAKDLDRPGLAQLMADLEAGDTLAVAKLDRLTRSVVDFGRLLEDAKHGGWFIVALDLGVDTSTPTGELVANVMVAVSQWERRIIGQRTKEALAEVRANGTRLGRPPVVGQDTDASALALREHNPHLTLEEIGNELLLAGFRPPNGKRWYASTVSRAIDRGRETREGHADR